MRGRALCRSLLFYLHLKRRSGFGLKEATYCNVLVWHVQSRKMVSLQGKFMAYDGIWQILLPAVASRGQTFANWLFPLLAGYTLITTRHVKNFAISKHFQGSQDFTLSTATNITIAMNRNRTELMSHGFAQTYILPKP